MNRQIITQERYAEIQQTLGRAAGVAKLYAGVCNNCTYIIMADALDAVKKTPMYKHKIKHEFTKAREQWMAYEHHLLHNQQNRLFHIGDLSEADKKKYSKELTDRDYFDFWQGCGGAAYVRTQDQINVLRHKYYLSLTNHGVPYADAMSRVLLTEVCLKLSCDIHRDVVKECIKNAPDIPPAMIERVLAQLSLEKIEKAWHNAMMLISPKIFEYDLDEFEYKNQEMALKQLAELWTSDEFVFDSTADATQDYSEVFRTKGESKKAYRIIKEAKAELNAS